MIGTQIEGRSSMDVFSDSHDIFILGQEFSFLGSGQLFVNLTVALMCGLLIALFYRWTYGRKSSSITFSNSLIAFSMITAVVITVVGNNLARAFGLVGALSIIRFRMSVKDVQDIVFIFFALAVGMAAGVNLLLTAILGALFIGLVIVVLYRLSQASGALPTRFTLEFSVASSGAPDDKAALYRPVLGKYSQRYKLTRVQSSESGDALVLSFSGVLTSGRTEDLVRALEQIPGVDRVVLSLKSRKKKK
jgi:uncharacterized membrane protein YhiD involved in acid resistance